MWRRRSAHSSNPSVDITQRKSRTPRVHTRRPKAVSSTIMQSDGDAEEHQRIFYTRRDPRHVRTLKSLHLLPRTPSTTTYAEIGIQVEEPSIVQERALEAMLKPLTSAFRLTVAHWEEVRNCCDIVDGMDEVLEDFTSHLSVFEDSLEHVENQLIQFREQLDPEIQLKEELNNKELELNENQQMLTRALDDLAEADQNQKQFQSSIDELQLETERLELDVAFLTEEKYDLDASLTDHKNLLEIISQEKDDSIAKEDELKSALMQTKISSAEQVGKYLDELNMIWAEKRNFIRHKLEGRSVSKQLKKYLTMTDRNLMIEEERNRLADQVELLSTQAVFQDLLLEQFQTQLMHIYRAWNSTDPGPLRDSLIGEGLDKAKNLVKSEAPIFKVATHASEQIRSAMSASSLPCSPLQAADVWSGDRRTQSLLVTGSTNSPQNQARTEIDIEDSLSSERQDYSDQQYDVDD